MSINTKMVYSGEVKKKMRMSGSEVEIIMARQELTKMSMAEKIGISRIRITLNLTAKTLHQRPLAA